MLAADRTTAARLWRLVKLSAHVAVATLATTLVGSWTLAVASAAGDLGAELLLIPLVAALAALAAWSFLRSRPTLAEAIVAVAVGIPLGLLPVVLAVLAVSDALHDTA